MGLIYLDSAFCIYAAEYLDSTGDRARELIASSDSDFAISPLVRMECLVMPIRLARFDLESEYKRFFAMLTLLPITAEVYEQATLLRAAHQSLRTPDAIHLATAQVNGCSRLWTGDVDFARVGAPFVRNVFASLPQ